LKGVAGYWLLDDGRKVTTSNKQQATGKLSYFLCIFDPKISLTEYEADKSPGHSLYTKYYAFH